jgi:two-component system response regulator HydG
MKGAKVLIVDDDRSMCEMLASDLTEFGHEVQWRTSSVEALDLILTENFDAVATDLNMPGLSGIDFCSRMAENRPDLPVIVITAFGSMDTAISAIRAGAYDFLTKPFESEALSLIIERAASHRALREEVKRLREQVGETEPFEEMLGKSAAMKRLFGILEKVADTETSILVTGETGSGKELVARALHHRSRRRNGPFVALNCAAMPPQLLESELFGHVKGAFTDAKRSNQGLFLQANHGTLFLDEIGELPLALQPKLLRVLQERSVRPVGGTEDHSFDVRLLAATNQDLEDSVEAGRFRQDLLFRINVIQVDVPPLRARGNDVLLLAQHFIEQTARRSQRPVKGLTSAVADKLVSYSWPGNVRELQNSIERAVALTEHEKIVVEDLPEKVRDYRSATIMIDSHDPGELLSMDQVEKRYINRVLEAVGGNKAQASRILGFDRKTLYRKLERYCLGDNQEGCTAKKGRM